MKYRPTFLNLYSVILMVWSYYSYWTSEYRGGEQDWGALYVVVMTVGGLLGLLVDFALQKRVKSYFYVNGIELLIISGIWLFEAWYKREKTLVIPDNFKGYVTIVYGVKGAEPLFLSPLNFGYSVEISESGILFTSTSKSMDIWTTNFQTFSGILLDHTDDTTTLHASDYEDGEYVCNGKTLEFRTWLVNNHCGWNKEVDIDSMTIPLIREYCETQNN
ncbi:MAG: hypothetical protein ACYC1Q_13335 [Bacteroidia bacterium]